MMILPTLRSLLLNANEPLIDRDLSWLQFNERVLSQARDKTNPLLERMKFLAITGSNLDEFMMIRFSQLKNLSAGMEEIQRFTIKQLDTLEQLESELSRVGIRLLRHFSEKASPLGERLFKDHIVPRLGAPMPMSVKDLSEMENLQTAAVWKWQGQMMGLLLPKNLPLMLSDGSMDFYPLEGLLQAFLPSLLRGLAGIHNCESLTLLRITRDGDLNFDLEHEDPEAIPDRETVHKMIRSRVGSRDRGKLVRIQYLGRAGSDLIQEIQSHFRLWPEQVLPAPGLLNFAGLSQIGREVKIPELSYPPLVSHAMQSPRDPAQWFEKLDQGDVMLHHPYDSFDQLVSWVEAACRDPQVISIEQTIYRVDALSPLMERLKTAAKNKRVRMVIEPRARFDELNNLRLAEELREAGVEVSYGLGPLKVHAKLTLVTRHTPDGIKRYTHLSTGNYNATTARQYTDLSVITSNADIGADAHDFFEAVWNTPKQMPHLKFRKLLSAPSRLHRRLISLIRAETLAARRGKPARIIAKVNALVDPILIKHLYEASQAGVSIHLIVRGACALIPGVVGLSENIQVISIVDRFLEHSRIYYFGSMRKIFLSSADWMPRNFFSRFELAFPVLDPKNFAWIEQVVLPTYLAENVKAFELTSTGTWKRRRGSPTVRAQETLLELTSSPPANVIPLRTSDWNMAEKMS